jgi:hypothetical protein
MSRSTEDFRYWLCATSGGYLMTYPTLVNGCPGCGFAYTTLASGAGPHDFAACAERRRVSSYYEQQLSTLRAALARAEAELGRAKPVVDAAVYWHRHSGTLTPLWDATDAYLASEPKETK